MLGTRIRIGLFFVPVVLAALSVYCQTRYVQNHVAWSKFLREVLQIQDREEQVRRIKEGQERIGGVEQYYQASSWLAMAALLSWLAVGFRRFYTWPLWLLSAMGLAACLVAGSVQCRV